MINIYLIPQGPSVSDCINAACDAFVVRRLDLLSQRRSSHVMRARQVAMWLARYVMPLSLQEIGDIVGARCHSTVRYSIRAVEDRRESNSDFRSITDHLLASLTEGRESL